MLKKPTDYTCLESVWTHEYPNAPDIYTLPLYLSEEEVDELENKILKRKWSEREMRKGWRITAIPFQNICSFAVLKCCDTLMCYG